MPKHQPPPKLKQVLDDLCLGYHWSELANLAIVSDEVGSKAWDTFKSEGFLVQRHPRKDVRNLYWVSEKRV